MLILGEKERYSVVVIVYLRSKGLGKMAKRWEMKDPNKLCDVDVTTWLCTLDHQLDVLKMTRR